MAKTAREYAQDAMDAAVSDVLAAQEALSAVPMDAMEAIQRIAEAREQLEFAQTALAGRLFELVL